MDNKDDDFLKDFFSKNYGVEDDADSDESSTGSASKKVLVEELHASEDSASKKATSKKATSKKVLVEELHASNYEYAPSSPDLTYTDSKSTYEVAGVGVYKFGYRLKNFILIFLLSVVLGAIVFGAAYLLELLYIKYIFLAVLTGVAITILYYIFSSVGLRRRNGDRLTAENYIDIYVNNERKMGKPIVRAYKHFNGAYYATVYSIIAAFIIFALEIAVSAGLNYTLLLEVFL